MNKLCTFTNCTGHHTPGVIRHHQVLRDERIAPCHSFVCGCSPDYKATQTGFTHSALIKELWLYCQVIFQPLEYNSKQLHKCSEMLMCVWVRQHRTKLLHIGERRVNGLCTVSRGWWMCPRSSVCWHVWFWLWAWLWDWGQTRMWNLHFYYLPAEQSVFFKPPRGTTAWKLNTR